MVNFGSMSSRHGRSAVLAAALVATALVAQEPVAGSSLEVTRAEAVVANALGLSSKGMEVVSDRGETLSVEIEPLRQHYEVDEPIRFRVRGDSAFYIYLFSIDAETGETALIFPNNYERDNHYPSRRWYLIPNRDAEFYSDAPGTEEVMMVASREPLDDPEAVADGEGRPSKLAAELERALEQRGLRIERDDRGRWLDTGGEDVLLKRLELTITGDEQPSRRVSEAATALIGTAHDTYYAGERFEVTFGATADGWVHLYLLEPGGAVERLEREAVEANRIQSKSVRAAAPYGLHTLVAVYTPEKRLDRGTEAELFTDDGEVLVPDDEDIAVAVRRVRIRR